MNKNANSADVRHLTRTTAKAPVLKSLYWGGHSYGQIYLWLPHLCQNYHLCTKNEIFYTIMHMTKNEEKLIKTQQQVSSYILFMTSNHQTTNFLDEFFSVLGVEKEKELFIGPNQVFSQF